MPISIIFVNSLSEQVKFDKATYDKTKEENHTVFCNWEMCFGKGRVSKNAQFFLWWVYILSYQTKNHGLMPNIVNCDIFGFQAPNFNTHLFKFTIFICFLMHVPYIFRCFYFNQLMHKYISQHYSVHSYMFRYLCVILREFKKFVPR